SSRSVSGPGGADACQNDDWKLTEGCGALASRSQRVGLYPVCSGLGIEELVRLEAPQCRAAGTPPTVPSVDPAACPAPYSASRVGTAVRGPGAGPLVRGISGSGRGSASA